MGGGKLGESVTSQFEPAKASLLPQLVSSRPMGAKGRGHAHAPPEDPNRFSVNAAVAPLSRSSNNFLPPFTYNYELFLNPIECWTILNFRATTIGVFFKLGSCIMFL